MNHSFLKGKIDFDLVDFLGRQAQDLHPGGPGDLGKDLLKTLPAIRR